MSKKKSVKAEAATLDFTKKRLSTRAVLNVMKEFDSAFVELAAPQLVRFLKSLENYDIELEPTNAKTEKIIENALVGAGLGGIAGGLTAVMTGFNPVMGILGGAVIGAAAGAFVTKYKVTIIKLGQNQKGEEIYQLKLKSI